MNVNPLAALSSFAAKASAILPKGFSGPQQEIALTTYDEMSDVSKWMQQEKFLHFAGMLVIVPPGFNTYVMDHLNRLDRKSTRLNSSHSRSSRMPSSA